MGIEPTYAAWEAAVLPMNYSRRAHFLDDIIPDAVKKCNTKNVAGISPPGGAYSENDYKEGSP